MKNGFTLMELLGVIVILSLLILLIVPNILEQVSNKEGDVNEAYQEAAVAAAQLYADEYPTVTGCVPLTTLQEEGFLTEAAIDELGKDYANAVVIISANDKGAKTFTFADSCP